MIKAQILENHKIMISKNAISDSVKYETVKFSFPYFWEKYQKTAVFKNGETVISVLLDKENPLCLSENECYIPHEVLHFPGFSVSVFGNEDETLATTANGFVVVIKSGYENGIAPKDPTPNEYAQIIGLMDETKSIAQSVRNDADNGLFKGEKGDTGEQGPQGSKGDKGDKGDSAITEQSYNPESENAQSGKAVAEALNKAVSASLFEVLTVDANEEQEYEFTNILNEKSAFTEGKFVHYNTGEIIDAHNYWCTEEYISIPENVRLFANYTASTTKNAYPYIVYYDENKSFIGSQNGTELTQEDYNGIFGAFYNVPPNTRYIRMSIPKLYMESFQSLFLYIITEKYKENSISDITEPIFNIVMEMEDEFTNILNEKAAFTEGKMVHYNTGEIIDSTNYSCTEEYVSIPENARLFANYTASTTRWAYPYIVYYDENKNFIRSEAGWDITQTDYNGMLGVFYNIPQNTRYIRMSITTNFMEHFDSIFLYLVTEKSNISVKVKGLIMPKSKIEGENVVFFGDSIFGMYRDNTSVANRFAEITGANVYNVGFGGCRMSVHPTSGYGEFSMCALADAIYNEDWTSQEAAASSGAAYFPEQLSVLKNIDFNTVHRVVIHYGTNDFTGNIQIDNANNPLDHTTLCGALRYSLEKLLTKYPHLRVYISAPAFRYWPNDNQVYPNAHTNGNGELLTDFIYALTDTAKEYGIPVLDNYHELGVNKLNAPAFIEDGAHHNELGRARLGYYIASKICGEL